MRTIPIWATEELGAVLRDVVREKYGDNLSAAAKDAGVSRTTFFRLVNGQSEGCHADILGKLRSIVPRKHRIRFDQAVVGSAPRMLLRQYDRWLKDQAKRVPITEAEASRRSKETTLRKRMTLQFLDRARYGRMPRGERLIHVLFAMVVKFPRLFREFNRFLRESCHSEERRRLALHRIVEPLVDAEDAGWIERSWWEMSVAELEGFIEARMKGERILLYRSPDLQRALEVATDKTQTEGAQLRTIEWLSDKA